MVYEKQDMQHIWLDAVCHFLFNALWTWTYHTTANYLFIRVSLISTVISCTSNQTHHIEIKKKRKHDNLTRDASKRFRSGTATKIKHTSVPTHALFPGPCCPMQPVSVMAWWAKASKWWDSRVYVLFFLWRQWYCGSFSWNEKLILRC